MDERYRGMPETDWLIMALDGLRMRSSIERVGDDILICDSLDGDEIHDGFKFAREEEENSEELDVSREMEILEKWYKKHEKK